MSRPLPRATLSRPGFAGRTAVVTGASSGIGRACALALADAGAGVVAVARGREALDQLASEIGPACQPMPLDVLDVDATAAALAAVPRVDLLVNCAGRNLPEPIGDVTPERFDAVFDLNVRATFFLCRAAVLRMRSGARGGAIVTVSSQMGHVGAPDRTVYCASKHAIEGLTKALALEVAHEGIRVNSVCPTFVETAMTASMLARPDAREAVIGKIPLGRVGTPGDVTGAVLFLLSDAAAMVTGTSLLVDGGWTAQ